MSGIGFDADVIQHTSLDLKKYLGIFSYVFIAIKQLFRFKFKKILLHINEKPTPKQAYYVLISNTKFYGGNFHITSQSNNQDGLLDICLLTKGGIKAILLFILSVLRGRLEHSDAVEFYQARCIRIKHNHPIHVDAEYLGDTSLDAKIIPKRLDIIC